MIHLQEVALVLAMPHMSFRLNNRRQYKQYLLMMSSDYERSEWRDTIAGLLHKGLLVASYFLLLYFVSFLSVCFTRKNQRVLQRNC
jgi:hypothetical protein